MRGSKIGPFRSCGYSDTAGAKGSLYERPCHFGDRKAVSLDGEDGVITLFHLAELLEHSATSLRDLAQIGGARCRVSTEHEMSLINRRITLVGRPGLDPGTLGLKVPCSSR